MSSIKNIDYLACVRLDASIWSARARLRREDLPDSIELPPEDMATLGSKRLFDPAKLRIFNTLKARAAGVLDKRCVKFLGGWATHEELLPELAAQLGDISDEFNRAKADFLQSYDEGVASWLESFPQWANILRNAVPSAQEVSMKFAFNWQMFKLAPADGVAGAAGNNLGNTVNNLERDVAEEIAKSLQDVYKECFDGKDVVTKKALRPVQTIIDKVRALAFIHPHLGGLEAILKDALSIIDGNTDNKAHVAMFKNFLVALRTPEGILGMCSQHVDDGEATENLFDPFWTFGAASVEEVVAESQPDMFSIGTCQMPAVMDEGEMLTALAGVIGGADSAEEVEHDAMMFAAPSIPMGFAQAMGAPEHVMVPGQRWNGKLDAAAMAMNVFNEVANIPQELLTQSMRNGVAMHRALAEMDIDQQQLISETQRIIDKIDGNKPQQEPEVVPTPGFIDCDLL